MKHLKQWLEILSRLQREFNNSSNSRFISNEIAYDFISIQAIDLRKSFANSQMNLKNNRRIIKLETSNAIVFSQMNAKSIYDEKHLALFMKSNDYVMIRLHYDYDISSIIILRKKLNQQYVESFKILERVDRLTYRLELSQYWRIHLVLLVAQLKFTFFKNDSFHRSRFDYSKSIYVKDDI